MTSAVNRTSDAKNSHRYKQTTLTDLTSIEGPISSDNLVFGPLWIVVGIVLVERLLYWWSEAGNLQNLSMPAFVISVIRNSSRAFFSPCTLFDCWETLAI